MPLNLKEPILLKQRLSEVIPQMLLGYTICTGMCGNFVLIPGMTIIRVPLEMVVLGKLMTLLAEFCAVVGGLSIRGVVDLDVAIGPIAPTSIEAEVWKLVFALRVLRRELFNFLY